MLTNLSINNFAIVKSLYLDLFKGMTTITGETGAGKSIAIDALSLCLGGRSDSHMVRPNEEKADITATFLLENNQGARQWLEENELNNDDEFDECIIRRIITNEGRSRGFINGRPVPLSQLKSIGQYLINIHGQHAHHQLMKSDYQLTLLDQYSGHKPLLERTRGSFNDWKIQQKQLDSLRENSQENLAKKQLLEYQVKELDELNLQQDEFELLEQEHKLLSSHGEISALCQESLEQLVDNEQGNAFSLLNSVSHSLQSLAEFDQQLSHLPNLINDALIQIEETQSEVRHYLDKLDVDPMKIAHVEERFSQVMSMARKHNVQAEKLFEHHQTLKAEIEALDCSDEKFDALEQAIEKAKAIFEANANQLTKSRQKFANQLNKLISSSMHELSMEKAQFKIDIQSNINQAGLLGVDQIQFLVSANPGQPLQPLAKVASGGELSRISLAIQVITAQKVQTPSLIFDEVDVGISGPTARVVGKMLRQLGESTQVICVTHLPQVAGSGHQQLFVAKQATKDTTETNILQLNNEQRVEELARLLGGDAITESTKANAKEMLMSA